MIGGMESMDVYLVGGAVRDALLGIEGGDRDWVVVGETPDAMTARGFRPVGRDFPVFLHPDSNEEYALARTERKSGRGHRGFVVDADPSVTLEEDLARRDFTINAIARRADGTLVDPFGGARDIEARVLRHVGPAFTEDPLRVLRAARFMARLAPLGFRVADETRVLMREMVAAGELQELVPERVWQELVRAIASAAPSAFLRTLHDCGALAVVLPESALDAARAAEREILAGDYRGPLHGIPLAVKDLFALAGVAAVFAFLLLAVLPASAQPADTVYTIVDQPPVLLPTPQEAQVQIAQAFVYPPEAAREGISGTVFLRLVVDTAGLVTYPGVLDAGGRGVRTGGDARNREYVAGHVDSTAVPAASTSAAGR